MIAKTIIFSSLCSLLFFTPFLHAESESGGEKELFIEEHVSIRSRELNHFKRDYIKELRSKQLEGEKEQTDNKRPFRRAKLQTGKQFQFAERHSPPRLVLASLHTYPIPSHWLTNVADDDQSFEIEDGSNWGISSSDALILRSWHRNDSLVITPNYQWFSAYDYYITNKHDGSYVKANLEIGPINHGTYSHWIIDIDYFTGHVFMENQTVWCVHPDDKEILRDWLTNDHIIFGQYNSCFSSYDHILINVNMDDHIRVKQY